MTLRPLPNHRALVALLLVIVVVGISCASIRARLDGPRWGVQVALSAEGRAVAADLDGVGAAWVGGLRPGDELLSVGDADAHSFVGRPLSGTSLAFVDGSGGQHLIDPGAEPKSTPWLLAVGAFLFVVIGGLVYRWSADQGLGRVFLALATCLAAAELAMPAARLGFVWAGYVSAAAGLLAAPGLMGLFLLFPRPFARAGRLVAGAFAFAALLTAGQLVQFAFAPNLTGFFDGLEWLWMMLNTLGAVGLLLARAARRTDRPALAPLLVGTAVGVAPLLILVALPRLLNAAPLIAAEVAVIPLAAIPLAFAYAILRHQVFGLDALLRRVLLRVSSVVIAVPLFFGLWLLLQAAGLASVEAAAVATVIGGLAMPSVASWTAARVDAWLYRSIHRLGAGAEDDLSTDTLAGLGQSVALRLRQVLPVQWTAVILEDQTSLATSAARRVLGVDGAPPAWLATCPTLADAGSSVTTSPVVRFEEGVVLLLAGPRLDGSSLDGIQTEAVHTLARATSATFEAGLLRARADDEARFRQGLTELARDLGAAATVADVLRVFTTQAARLLQADTANLWRRGTQRALEPLSDEPRPTIPSAAVLRELGVCLTTVGRLPEWTLLAADGMTLGFGLDDGADEPIVCLVTRAADATPFTARDERRAQELTEHTTGALRRAAEREVLEEQLRHRAFYDSLTGLPNRALFLDRLAHGLARNERLDQELAVLFVDLDRFKIVNDSLGHSAGDELLVQVGARLRGCLRESDTIARLGGDEYTVLLEGPSAMADAVRAAERILHLLEAPFVVDGQETYASSSIGISGGTRIRESGRDLLREADIALYRAKADGRGRYAIFEPRMNHLPAEHLHLESDLHRAIERNELRVHYQPIFALADGRVTGLEALVRWEHPTKGLIAPGHFIPLAEDTGLIAPIGRWVLEEACRQMREWQATLPAAGGLFVSVNLSARQLQDAQLVSSVESAIRASGLEPRHLHLEITESVVMADPETTVTTLNALKALGIKLAVDDFGTGYSSLAYLKRFPIDVLKIDRAFVGGLNQGGHDMAIVRTIVGLARALGLHTTAEGIEEHAQWALLEELGCDQGQGFVFARPLRAEAVADLLARPVLGRPRLLSAAA